MSAPFLHEGEAADARTSTVSTVSQGYLALVWRRFRRSIPGMLVLIMVSALLFTALFAPFMAPMDPNQPAESFAPPDQISFFTKDGFTLWPVAYRIEQSATEFDPITFQPLMAPDMDNPRPLRLFVEGWSYRLWGLIPMDTHLIGLADGETLHLLGTDNLGRDILARGIIGSRISLIITLTSITLITIVGTLLGITSGYIAGRFDLWFLRFVAIILGFLGFAVKPPLKSWGLMLQDAGTLSVIGSYPWILSPVGFVLLAVFDFNALGDGLRDAIDPY